jgi:hypothetical protein
MHRLTVELSQQNRFELVERDKVTAIGKELNLTATGLAAPEPVARLLLTQASYCALQS